MNIPPSLVTYLKDPRSIAAIILIVVLCVLIFTRGSGEPNYPINPGGLIQGSVSDISFLDNGEVAVSYNGQIIEPAKHPLPDSVTAGDFVNFQPISLFATRGSPIKVYVKTGSATYCYRIESTNGKYLGPC